MTDNTFAMIICFSVGVQEYSNDFLLVSRDAKLQADKWGRFGA